MKRILYFFVAAIVIIALSLFFIIDQKAHKDQVFSDVSIAEITTYPSFAKIDSLSTNKYETVESKRVYNLMNIVHATLISDFVVFNNNLFLLLRGAEDPIFHIVFNKKEIVKTEGFGARGKGPEEFSLPIHFGIDYTHPNNLMVFDQRTRRISVLSIDKESNSLLLKGQYLVDIDFLEFWFYKNKIFANGDFFDDKAIVVLEKKDGVFTKVDAFKYALFTTENTEFTPAVLVHLNRSSMTASPQVKYLAKAYLYVPIIQIFNNDGELLKEIKIKENFSLNYEIRYDERENIYRFIRTKETLFAYLSITTSSDYIYALFFRTIGSWIPRK